MLPRDDLLKMLSLQTLYQQVSPPRSQDSLHRHTRSLQETPKASLISYGLFLVTTLLSLAQLHLVIRQCKLALHSLGSAHPGNKSRIVIHNIFLMVLHALHSLATLDPDGPSACQHIQQRLNLSIIPEEPNEFLLLPAARNLPHPPRGASNGHNGAKQSCRSR